MANVIGVRFKTGGKTYFFDPGEIRPASGDQVIVETARGVECGEVVFEAREAAPSEIVTPLKPLLREATAEEIATIRKNGERRSEVFSLCEEKILHHKLDMKLVDVEFTFDGKIVFYFTSEGRVDFRELVRDLAAVFHTRIELRQIGVRDEAKMLGGLGPCGRGICCRTFLPSFQPVSIKMAKEQSLSLNPTKISGLCGRLLCCLKYEQDSYEAFRKLSPKVGKEVSTPDGVGIVQETYAVKELVRVRFVTPENAYTFREYPLSRVRPYSPNEPILPFPDDEKKTEGGETSPPPAERERRSGNRSERMVQSATTPEQRVPVLPREPLHAAPKSETAPQAAKGPRTEPAPRPPRAESAPAQRPPRAEQAPAARPPRVRDPRPAQTSEGTPASPPSQEASRANRFRGSADMRNRDVRPAPVSASVDANGRPAITPQPKRDTRPQPRPAGSPDAVKRPDAPDNQRRTQTDPAKRTQPPRPRIANADQRVKPAALPPMSDPSTDLTPDTFGARDPNAPAPSSSHRRGGRRRHHGPKPGGESETPAPSPPPKTE